MSYKVLTIEFFDKQLKRLVKKYPSLKSDFARLVAELEENPLLGVAIGHGCYKIRVKISSKNKGKAGGARVITYVTIAEEAVYLLSVYDKSEKDTMSDKELIKLLELLE